MLSYAKKENFGCQKLVDAVCCVDKARDIFIGTNGGEARNFEGEGPLSPIESEGSR